MTFKKPACLAKRDREMLSLKQVVSAGLLVWSFGGACSSTPSPPPTMTTTTIPSMGLELEIPAGWVGKQQQDGSTLYTPANIGQYRGRNSLQIWPGSPVPQGTIVMPISSRLVLDGSLEFTVYEGETIVSGQKHRMEAWVYFLSFGPAMEVGMGSVRQTNIKTNAKGH